MESVTEPPNGGGWVGRGLTEPIVDVKFASEADMERWDNLAGANFRRISQYKSKFGPNLVTTRWSEVRG